MKFLLSTFSALTSLCLSSLAAAHVTLQVREAPAGSTYRAVLQVPHGCAGEATEVLRVRIPDGMRNVKPMPKAGWELVIIEEELAEPYTNHGNLITSRVAEVQWRGGNLADAHYDEFILRGSLPNTPNSTLLFPTVQECASGAERWIESETGGRYPAPRLQLR